MIDRLLNLIKAYYPLGQFLVKAPFSSEAPFNKDF